MATYRTRTARDGSTSVHAQVRMTGYPARTASFPNKRDAQKWAATVEAEMIEGRHFKDAAGRKRTLAEAIKRFRTEVLPLKKNGSMYGFTLDWWEANHGTKKLGEVSRGWLADARAQLLTGTFTRATPGTARSMLAAGIPAASFHRTPATANRYMAALSAVFSQVCGNWEWLQPGANPFAGLGKLPEGKNKGKAYADEARARLLQETAKDPQLHRLVRVALGTAARAGELVGLTWSHVELGETEGQLMFEDTKNGESRIAWLYGDALEAMREQHAYQFPAGTHPCGLSVIDHLSRPVFPGQWSHKHQRYGKYDYLPRLHKALAAAGLNMSRPFHALRHTAATELARMGANSHQLKAIGGWKSDAVNRYVHMASQDTKALTQALSKRLEAPTAGGK
jgi:integrase